MSSNALCSNCQHFMPKEGEKYFNCTSAKQAGAVYAMQVQADTRSCEAFSPIKQPSELKATPKSAPQPALKRAEPPPGALCGWGRTILVAALVLIVFLIAWGAYSCFSGPAPTPPSTPTPTATPGPPPTMMPVTTLTPPTPVSIQYVQVGQWANLGNVMVSITSVERTKFYNTPGPVAAPPGTSFIFVSVTMLNASSSSISAQATDFSIVDSSGIVYGPQALANSFYGAFPFTVMTIQPGNTVTGKIMCVVPDMSSGLEIHTPFDGQTVAWRLQF